MRIITLLQPPRIVFGDGCAPLCAGYLAERGLRRLLVVTSTAVRPHIGAVMNALSKAGMELVESPPVDCEPTCKLFDKVLLAAKAANPDAVLGIGGGSALDVAKLVAAMVRGSQSVPEVFGINRLSSRALHLVCLPTTAGTGSEVSPNSILLDEPDELKKGVVSPHLVADAAFIDPQLTHSLPPAVTAATGLDALTHCLEAFANRFAHPVVDVYALQGIRLIAANLPRAVRHGFDNQARAEVALGSLYGGLCLGPVNTAAVHALAYPLGGQFHVAHGVANSVLLPHVIRFNLPHAVDRYAEAALALGVERDTTAAGTAERGLARLVELSRICGIPQRLSELGVPREALPAMAKAAMQVTRLLNNNLRPLTEDDARQIYEMAY